jgi:hypothetical protein
MRALALVAPLLFGCTLLRDADDVIVGTGVIDSAVIDSSPLVDAASDARESGGLDYRFALWRMPSNTPTSYETTGDVVVDKLTGLEWQRTAGGPATYDEAAAACAAKSLRLPTRIELVSLLAIARGTHPAILSTAFPSTPEAPFWTSSTIAAGGRYVVHFGDATVRSALGTESNPYRCVRAP